MSINVKSPTSYFFTESSFNQVGTNTSSFGPINDNEFQITTTFNNPLKAYAVTSGTLFYAQCGASTDLVNIILKPNKDLNIGVKIKYFVYRGIKINEIFKVENGVAYLKESNSNLLAFLHNVWDEYTEFYQTANNFTAEKIGYLDNTVSADDIVNMFFSKDKHNLLHIEAGTHIGTFANGGGFEIVLDEGDFLQNKSDTGLMFDEKFAGATKTILKVDGEYQSSTYIFGGNKIDASTGNTSVSSKIFRENIYRFLDPAAFYGAHAKKDGEIKIKDVGAYNSPQTIYSNIVSKFINSSKVYFYIKSTRNRSYKFYKPDNEKTFMYRNDITSSTSSWLGTLFMTNKWPILIKSTFSNKEGFIIHTGAIGTGNIIASNHTISEFHTDPGQKYLLRKGNLILSPHAFKFELPLLPNGNNISNIVYLDFFDKDENAINDIFGNVNVNAILETQDVSDIQGSIVNNVRSVLLKKDNEAVVYNTKIILDGDHINSTNPTGTSSLTKNLRTYILFPQFSTKSQLTSYENNLTAGYFLKKENSPDTYINKIYNKGEIWKGTIKNGTLKSFIYQRANNDEDMPIYQLGISQEEYNKLTDASTDPTNISVDAVNYFFYFDNEQPDINSSYIKYDLKIQYDNSSGERKLTNISVPIYTVDGYFYFTDDYSVNFLNHNREMANIAVDFLPIGLLNTNKGYGYGFDFIGHKLFDLISTDPINRDRYTDLVGSYTVTDTFIRDKRRFLNLSARKYNGKPTNWRNIGVDDFPLHTDSFITLYPTKEATVKLKFTKKTNTEVFDKLFIRYNKKYVSINNSAMAPTATDQYAEFVIPKTNYNSNINSNYNITIKSLQASSVDIPLEVFAVKGAKTFPAGKCWLRKNDKTYTLDIVIVNCRTKISGVASDPVDDGIISGNMVNLRERLKNFLGQILVTPNLILDTSTVSSGVPIELDLSNDVKFKPGTGSFIDSGRIVSSDKMFEHCFSLLPTAYQAKCVLFFFHNGGISGTDNVAGEAYIKNEYIGGAYGAGIYNATDQNTVAHEILHSVGLYHTFDNDSDYTFSKGQTDNIMDYTTDDNRKLVYYWQDEKVKNTNNNNKLVIVK